MSPAQFRFHAAYLTRFSLFTLKAIAYTLARKELR